jgi:hypothetical protein
MGQLFDGVEVPSGDGVGHGHDFFVPVGHEFWNHGLERGVHENHNRPGTTVWRNG